MLIEIAHAIQTKPLDYLQFSPTNQMNQIQMITTIIQFSHTQTHTHKCTANTRKMVMQWHSFSAELLEQNLTSF